FPWGNAEPDGSKGNLLENGLWSVAPIGAFPEGQTARGLHQMIGDVWEWTTSDYVPYPGFKSEFDEYNDKWFVGQKVFARRIVRDSANSHSLNLSKFFSSRRALDDRGVSVRKVTQTVSLRDWSATVPLQASCDQTRKRGRLRSSHTSQTNQQLLALVIPTPR
ncbi:MAG TPA: SUMF1/EgtB/PvdO family nonheme iron enzyme, partial [Pyrinomonadaceae bacterium]|nr:SUMF1/EgtB/PvdO family nonheme iron enzyme [Pyrinomonadaceae bacterium]